MQATISSLDCNRSNHPIRLRIYGLIAGFLIALTGLCYMISFQAIGLLIIGGLIDYLSCRGIKPLVFSWRYRVPLAAGLLCIWGILIYYGNETINQWRPHPSGYMVAWALCVAFVWKLSFLTHQTKLAETSAS